MRVKEYRVKGLVTVQTFVVQRSQSSAASMGYTTLEEHIDQKERHVHVQHPAGGGGIPHMKGMGMLVGNFELNP